MSGQSVIANTWKTKVEHFIMQHSVQNFIVFLIVLNAALLGLETNPQITQTYGEILTWFDHVILGIFTL